MRVQDLSLGVQLDRMRRLEFYVQGLSVGLVEYLSPTSMSCSEGPFSQLPATSLHTLSANSEESRSTA